MPFRRVHPEHGAFEPRRRADRLLAAALAHGAGRSRERGRPPVSAPTGEGRLRGHVHLGLRLLEELGAPAELLHAVACHHDARAARTAESMAKKPDEKSAAWFLLGAIYERQKKYGPAEKQFRKALEVDPNDAEVLNYYGYMLAEQGIRLEEAADLVKRALAQDSGNSAYLDSLGWTYYKLNRLADAREYLLRAATASPHDPTILGHLGDVYDRLGETGLALTTWQKALAEWKHAVPADYEADKVRDLERKVTEAKKRSERNKKHTASATLH